MKRTIKVAITGGIGSGKSIVSNLIESRGYVVIKSDKIAKEVMNDNKSVRKKIIKEFGVESFIGNKLNTYYLAQKIFSNKKNISKINSIVHPPTVKKIFSIIKKENKESKIVFVESALIYEAKLEYLFDYVLLLTTDDKFRLKRVIERDGVSKEEVLKRMSHQLSDTKKKLKADFIIENNSSRSDLEKKTIFFLNILEAISAIKN